MTKCKIDNCDRPCYITTSGDKKDACSIHWFSNEGKRDWVQERREEALKRKEMLKGINNGQ